MPFITTPKISGKTETGIPVQIDPQSLEQNDHITVICDYKDCGDGKPTNIQWDQKSVAERPEGLPDAAKKIIRVIKWDGTQYVMCSRKCLVNFLIEESEKEKTPITRAGLTLVKR